jgi:hypothetical protein
MTKVTFINKMFIVGDFEGIDNNRHKVFKHYLLRDLFKGYIRPFSIFPLITLVNIDYIVCIDPKYTYKECNHMIEEVMSELLLLKEII